MKRIRAERLPLGPLLRSFVAGRNNFEPASIPLLQRRSQAIQAARTTLCCANFLDHASDAEFAAAWQKFYSDAGATHHNPDSAQKHQVWVRYALNHLLRCPDPLPVKIERILSEDGPYHVPGFGPEIWSAIFQALAPDRCPAWLPQTELALCRLGCVADFFYPRHCQCYAALCQLWQECQRLEPSLTMPEFDFFLVCVAGLRNREIDPAAAITLLSPTMERELPIAHGPLQAFAGFCSDTFRFLEELARNNHRDWLDDQRERYHFVLREPLKELTTALAQRYVEPVLYHTHGWRLETSARTGKCLSSIAKNNYGRSAPYQTALWTAFHRPELGSKQFDAQLFVRVESNGISFGLHIPRSAKAALVQFGRNAQEHAQALFTALEEGGMLEHCHAPPATNKSLRADFRAPGLELKKSTIRNPLELAGWAMGRSITIARHLPSDSPLLRNDDLVGEILMTFEHLLPAYACAAATDPSPWLQSGQARSWPTSFHDEDFERHTHLGPNWLTRARTLLQLKRQLILQGVPGTGKTHVARSLGKLLTRGREDTIRLVQFHPAFGYEDFVEGIRASAVEVNGKHEVTYPVEDGLLCSFAAEATRRPSEPHVLIIDEINRGNLPRIFGELMHLLEYRELAVSLPQSRRRFRLPPNLYLIGTMNLADRSVAQLDQALRRRFSFMEMPPDATVLASWLHEHPPRAGVNFAQSVVALFEGLNLRLRRDLGIQYQIGHSYFMVPNLDESRLGMVWEHHIRPLLAEYFAQRPERLASYDLQRILQRPINRAS
jgi:hypothetical protein